LQEIKNTTTISSQSIHEIKDATMANTKAIARLESQIDHLVAELNIIKVRSQEMARKQYMTDENNISNPHHKHVQDTTTRGSEEIVDEIVSELSLEDPEVEGFSQDDVDLNLHRLLGQVGILCEPNIEDLKVECFAQSNLDLDKFPEQVKTFNEPSLEDPLEECFAQFDFDLDLDMISEQAKALLDSTPKM
jgi:hypothetical protein